MINELEKQFFQCFGIEPKEFKYNIGIWNNELNCDEEHIVTIPYIHYKNYSRCPSRDKGFIYPQITDRILLELICILALNPIHILFESMFSGIKEVELLKNSILLTCIANKDTIKHQVRTLFEEER